jgi:hypothetical protein
VSAAARSLTLALAARERGAVDECLHHVGVVMGTAEQEQQHDSLWRALTCAGNLYLGRGEPEKARPWYSMALESAKAEGLTRRMAGSAHDLFVLAGEMGDRAGMRHFAPLALELYPAWDKRVGVLVSDFALSDLTRGEHAAYARNLWRCVYAQPKDGRDRIIAATWLVFAAAHLQVEKFYTEALFYLAAALQEQASGEWVAISLNRAVEGMLMKGDFERAYTMACTAELAATTRGEAVQRERAAWLKDRADAARGGKP